MSTLPDFTGPGFFAGEAPDGLTTIAGTPTSASVRVYWRDPADPQAPDVLVTQTTSAPDGTWRITGLNPALRYVVRAQKSQFDDVTVVGAAPSRTDVIVCVDNLEPTEDFDGLTGHVLLDSGLPPFTCEVIDPLPYGLSVRVDGRKLLIEGASTDNGVWESVVRVTASNGVLVDVPLSIEIKDIRPRYWRIKVTRESITFSGIRACQIAELQFNGMQATGGMPLASSSFSGETGFGIAKAFDGDKSGNSQWSSTSSSSALGEWLGYAFATPQTVNSVSITSRNHGNIGFDWAPQGFDVESSIDGIEWLKEWSVPGPIAWGIAKTNTFERP